MRRLFVILATLSVLPLAAQNEDDARQFQKLAQVFRYLSGLYVDEVEMKPVVEGAITGMLEELDPHSAYIGAEEMKGVQESFDGEFSGIGVEFNVLRDTVIVVNTIAGGPAERVGVRANDRIVRIDTLDAVGMSRTDVPKHLRGKTGTKVGIDVVRHGTPGRLHFVIVRDKIPLNTVDASYLAGEGIGYIKVNRFGRTTMDEFTEAYRKLGRPEGLILDLRGNGGGSVQEAISIVNMFVPKGETILTMKGKIKQANREFTTKVEPIDTVMPIVVLVNDQTASASEITCGSLQDLDRAVVMGTRTFGKGLVQSTFDLPYNGVIKLTTSKYYIPSGRCIQAINYRHGRGGYTEHIPDSLTHTFTTRHGRIVRDGGGIKPDIEVLPDSLPNIAFYLASTGLDSTEAMLNWEVKYLKEHKTIAPAATFELSDADYEDFKAFVIQSGFKYDRESEKQLKNLVKLAKFEGYYDEARAEFDALEQRLNHNLAKDLDHNKEVIKAILAGDIVAAYYFQRGSVENKLLHDKQWKEAVKLLNDMDRYQRTLKPAPQEETAKTEVTAEP